MQSFSEVNFSNMPIFLLKKCEKLLQCKAFQKLISQICQYFLLKKCEKLLQCKAFQMLISQICQYFLLKKNSDHIPLHTVRTYAGNIKKQEVTVFFNFQNKLRTDNGKNFEDLIHIDVYI